MNDYTTIPLRRDTVAALARVRETTDGMPESYDRLMWRLVALAGRSIRTVDGTQAKLPPQAQVGGATMNDYTAITLRRDTVAALARVRETTDGMPESYDHLILRLAGEVA